jgi:hypothetical protein
MARCTTLCNKGTPVSYINKTGLHDITERLLKVALNNINQPFAPGFVNYKKGCTRLASDNQLLAHGRWFSPGTLASSTTKTGRHYMAEILLKVALNTKNQSNQSIK